MLIFICSDDFFPELFEKFGRCSLFLRMPDAACGADEIGAVVDQSLPNIRRIKDYLTNLSNTKFAPKIPMHNFQIKSENPIAAEAQANLAGFCDVMETYHAQLYDHSFVNSKKPYMRGAYMLDQSTGFQRDRLHHGAQLGGASRENGYHLINAFHLYGLAITPGWHFDVTRAGGGHLHHQFTDVLTGHTSSSADEHVNITPCDRLV